MDAEPAIIVGEYRGPAKRELRHAIGHALRRSIGVRGVKAYQRVLAKVPVS